MNDFIIYLTNCDALYWRKMNYLRNDQDTLTAAVCSVGDCNIWYVVEAL